MAGEELNKDVKEEPKDNVDATKKEDKATFPEQVTLKAEQYDALLDRMQELEELAFSNVKKSNKAPLTVDELANELERPVPKSKEASPSTEQIDLENLSNKELMGLIVNHIESNVGQPLLIKLEEMRIRDEIRELKNDKESGASEDFDSYREEIYRIASRNPNLSIKEAYKLAKSESKGNKKDSDNSDSSEGTILRLPPRTRPHGEKGSYRQSTTEMGAPKTRTEAAQRALDDMEKKGLFKG